MTKPNGVDASRIVEEFQSLLTLQCDADFPAAPLQNCPAGGRLNMVIIHQQYAHSHSQWPSCPLDNEQWMSG